MIDGLGARVTGPAELEQIFRRLRADIAADDDAELEIQANAMARAMEAAAPHHEGTLATTVKVIKKAPRHYIIVAGGAATRKRVKRGRKPVYDYARADEFGTVDMAAQPFFFPTYRRKKMTLRRRINARRRARIKALKL